METTTIERVLPEVPLLLTPAETATELGLSTSELRNMRDNGRGPQFTILNGTTVLYFRVKVLAWKTAHSAEEAA